MTRLAHQTTTQRGLAEAVGLDPRTIRDLTERGILTRDHRTQLYQVGASLRALRAYWEGKAAHDPEEGLDYNAERARLTKHQADRARLRYDREAGLLVEASAARLALEHALVPVRQYFQEQGSRLAPELVGLEAHEIQGRIDRANGRELERLADPELDFTGQPEDPELDLLPEDPDAPQPPARAGDPPGDADLETAEAGDAFGMVGPGSPAP